MSDWGRPILLWDRISACEKYGKREGLEGHVKKEVKHTMNIGLIGLPNSGKTTVFNALTKG